MEVDDIQTPQQARKFSRVSSNGGRIDSFKIATAEPTGTTTALENKKQSINPTTSTVAAATTAAMEVVAATTNRLRQWPHSSRIIRVSRASGGKDRHSKVWTARGPRDRRVRLSVNTAIQFYDLQDRLGYEQPSKAVEWLIKAAADAINELPSLDSCATLPPETPRQLSDERRADSADPDPDGDPGLGQNQQQQQQQLSKSGCSSNNSENSKGSGLSLSRTEIRVKARERARERTAKEKEKENEPSRVHVSGHTQQQNQQNVSTMPQTSSFTQLLTAGMSNLNETNAAASSSPAANSLSPDVGLFHKQARGSTNQWLASSTTAMDYFGTTAGLLGPSSSRQIQLTGVGANGNVYNFNFTISSSTTSSGLGAGFNRGTLQSNSPSLLPYLQRFSTTDGSSVPFFLGGAAVSSAASTEETEHHNHQYQPPGLQLCYGDGGRQSDQKGKAKS
ncbi:hypothetical protein Cgig2_029294 [Carnegiea gigantea]|uniref:Transcription factor TCP2-like n=1 Tax=Carnegiea gigantea TaxID=171969 RepID=A0A9Q1KUY2_9CARY|nr:hypothetical protein Cgig2_029294 [Carnegiea gigantea]